MSEEEGQYMPEAASPISDRDLDAFLAEHLFGAGKWCEVGADCQYDLVPSDRHWHDEYYKGVHARMYSSTGDGMLLVLEAMRGLKVGDRIVHYVEVCSMHEGRRGQWALVSTLPFYSSGPDRVDHWRSAESYPRALAEAAKAALEQESSR